VRSIIVAVSHRETVTGPVQGTKLTSARSRRQFLALGVHRAVGLVRVDQRASPVPHASTVSVGALIALRSGKASVSSERQEK
jgi:hypothetical protein